MSGSSQPPLPGKGITPENSPQNAEPPFARAASGREIERPASVPMPSFVLKFGPDGSEVKRGTEEDKRQQDMQARAAQIAAQIERENAGPKTRDTGRLRDDYDRARDHGR